MLPNTISSEELRRVTGFAKSSLTELEHSGMIARSAKDVWPIETLAKLFAHLRERKIVVSPERARFEQARAAREEMKAAQLAGELCRTKDFEDAWTRCHRLQVAGIVAIPARCTRDTALRRAIERELDAWRTDVADYFKRRADELEGKGGKAA